ncbi:hypothetical protein ACFL3D_00650 [Candidatus Omnitrophota bacterium]
MFTRKSLLVILCVITLFAVVIYSAELYAIGEVPVFIDPRYRVEYPPRFFSLGGEREYYVPERHLKIGIVINNRTEMDVKEIIRIIFSTSPLDRYRDFFVFANSNEVTREVRLNNHFITTYDAYGRRIGGGFDWTAMRVRAGLVVLDVNDYEWQRSGALGYAFKRTAITQKSTILHELGHVLGGLGDEYSIGEQAHNEVLEDILRSMGKEYAYRFGRGWTEIKDNLEYRTRNPLKWAPLIKQGHIPAGAFLRVELQENHDIGRFAIPCPQCVMNHPEKSDGQFCPVCQLQIISRISQFTGCPTPWDDYY